MIDHKKAERTLRGITSLLQEIDCGKLSRIEQNFITESCKDLRDLADQHRDEAYLKDAWKEVDAKIASAGLALTENNLVAAASNFSNVVDCIDKMIIEKVMNDPKK